MGVKATKPKISSKYFRFAIKIASKLKIKIAKGWDQNVSLGQTTVALLAARGSVSQLTAGEGLTERRASFPIAAGIRQASSGDLTHLPR